MKYKKRENFLIFFITATLALIFCIISLTRLYRDSIAFLTESVEEQLEFLKNLTSDELRIFYSYKHLLVIESSVFENETILFATKDKNFTSTYGKLRVFRMEQTESGDYFKIFAADGIRALHGLIFQTIKLKNMELQVVENKEDFNRKWKNSRFVDCLGLKVSNATRVIPESYVNDLVVFRNFIEQYHSPIFLFGGTLLGWYRECSFIRDTTDVDFAMKINELDESMLSDLQNSTLMNLYWILGKKNDSLELSVYSNNVKIDLFFVYHNVKNDWVGGMIVPEKRKLQWIYPHIGKLCTGDLLGRLFNVPCEIESVLEADYGPNWRVPHKTANFQWDKSHNNVRRVGFWERSDWADVYKTFQPRKKW